MAGPRDLVLVDTSAWISFFARTGSHTLKARLQRLLDDDHVATTGPVVLELLQGCRSEPERGRLEQYLRALHWLPVEDRHWYSAGAMAFRLRRRGITVSAVDAVIAAVADSHGCFQLQQDRDFQHIARHTGLRLVDS